MITDTIGFWDKEAFSHNENIFFIQKNTSKIWIENIIKAINDQDNLEMVANKSKSTVNETYNLDIFYRAIKKTIFN